jgi:hypothetical protein
MRGQCSTAFGCSRSRNDSTMCRLANNRLERYAGSAALHRRGSGGAFAENDWEPQTKRGDGMKKMILTTIAFGLCASVCLAQTARTTYSPQLNSSRTTFSDGTTARTTYSPLLNSSRTTFSDGTSARTTYSPLLNSARTSYSDGTTARTTQSPLLNSARTSFSDGSSARTTYSPLLNSSRTTFDNGTSVRTTYSPLLNSSRSTIGK